MKDIEHALGRLDAISKTGYWNERIIAQLTYLYHLSRVRDGEYDEMLCPVIAFVMDNHCPAGGVSEATAKEAEKRLLSLKEVAKQYEVICAAHAHIDMNWQWRWDETVFVTLDTFRTMLDFMDEYPSFTFSQSQASVYEIVERHDPDMLEEIRRQVHSGRWEVTASAWVEADKNMPNGESMARHILYTKQYLSDLLDIDPAELNIAFEPDTFGHNTNVPEILADGGVKYYYHCRGAEGEYLERWTAPSGRSIIVYREPFWYNAHIEPDLAFAIPNLCEKYGLKKFLKVYGVGNHGGGPTRRDIEKIIDMNTWPLFPKIRFGTFGEFFAAVEEIKDRLAVTKGEKNFIFTGCYTSQSRIKMANRVGEAVLNEAEAFASIGNAFIAGPYSNEAFATAWQNVLLNQFHDTLPGSCVIGSREHAMGLFQETVAIAGSLKKRALSAFANQINTSELIVLEDTCDTRAEGAGVGFGADGFRMSQPSRGAGKARIFHVFNPSPRSRKEKTEIVLWDWSYNLEHLVCRDETGNIVTHQVMDNGQYWGHEYTRVLIEAKVPAYGYSTYVVTEQQAIEPRIIFPRDPRVEPTLEPVLENDFIRATFDKQTCTLLSLIDKRTNEELVHGPAAFFRLIDEDIRAGTAWRVGRYMRVDNITEDVKIVGLDLGVLRQNIVYEVSVRDSRLRVTIVLDRDQARLDYFVNCDWQEIGNKEKGVPQLNFYVPLAYQCDEYKYDVPYGVISRKPMDRDVPGNSWAAAEPSEGKTRLMVITDSKYGFRGVNNSLAVTLIRSSFDPDPYPENGKIHDFRLSLCADNRRTNVGAIEQAYDANHPLTVVSAQRDTKGSLPLSQSFVQITEGTVAIAALKRPETRNNDSELIVRLYETEGEETEVTLTFAKQITEAFLVDINEHPLEASQLETTRNQVTFKIHPYKVASLKIVFDESNIIAI